ncbi:MAG: O-antigen ligase family protein [Sphingobium sp.]|nr:MAG: O-antigen ligase family protein [Sphingobium sp.]
MLNKQYVKSPDNKEKILYFSQKSAPWKWRETYFLISAWILIFISSITQLPNTIIYIFISIVFYINYLSAKAGIALLIIIMHSPSASLLIPGGAFSWAAAALLPRIFIEITKLNFIKNFRYPSVISAILFSLYALLTFFWLEDSTYFFKYVTFYWQAVLLCLAGTVLVARSGTAKTLMEVWAMAAGSALFVKFTHVTLGPDTFLYGLMADAVTASDVAIEQRVAIFSAGSLVPRLIWPGDEPNYASALLTIGLAIALALARSQPERRLGWLLCSAAIIVQIAGSYSRSGMLAATALLFYHAARGGKVFGGFSVVAAIGALITYSLYPPFQERLASMLNDTSGTTGERYNLWGLAVDEWSNAPFFGNGLTSYFVHVGWAAHNTYIQILAETGIVGLILWLAVPLFTIQRALHVAVRSSVSSERGFLLDLSLGFVSTLLIAATITIHDVKFLWFALVLLLIHANQTQLLSQQQERSHVQSA